MSKGTQLWPGDRMRGFFRAHIRRETSLDDATVERLATALTKAVNRMLVWEAPEAVQSEPAQAELAQPEIKAKPVAPIAETGNEPTPRELPPAERHARAENFNPYLFSALVALARYGEDGLMKRLQDIKSAEHLHAFAEAQHVPVDAGLKRPEDIRKAIVAAVERRLADRKAAAS